MPTVDKRNTVEHLHTGGSDVGLAVKLTAEEAAQIYGDSASAGWYVFGTFEGGTIAYEVDSEEDKDEAGQMTGKTIVSSREFMLSNTIKESDDATQDLIDDILVKSFHDYRYALPVGMKEVDDGSGGTTTKKAHQVYGVHNGKIAPGFEINTSEGEKRSREIELRSTKQGDTPAFVRKTVNLDDQTTWPEALAPFRDAAA